MEEQARNFRGRAEKRRRKEQRKGVEKELRGVTLE